MPRLSTILATASAAAIGAAAAASLAPPRAYHTPLGPALTSSAPFSRLSYYGGYFASGVLFGMGARRAGWVVSGASTVAAICNQFTAPRVRTPSGPPTKPKAALTVLLHNVLTTNHTGAQGLTAEAINRDADLVAVIEATAGPMSDELAMLSAHYSYEHSQGTDLPEALALFSRHPIVAVDPIEEGNSRLGFSALIDVEGNLVRVLVVHPKAPVKPSWTRQWLHDLEQIRGCLQRRDTPAVIVVGDFNADPAHSPYRALLRDAVLHEYPTQGNTWPAHPVVPPFYLIDHVLAGGPAEITHSSRTARHGSDHYGVAARVHLHS